MDVLPDDVQGWPDRVQTWWSRAVVDAKHPFRWAALATTGPDVRTVVLRGATDGVLVAHSDADTAKVEQLERDARAAWCFLHRKHRVQVRASGPVSLHRDDDVARATWAVTTKGERDTYGHAPAPGTSIAAPDAWSVRPDPTRLAVVRCPVDTLDVLWLRRGGHRRARFTRQGETWHGGPVVP